MSSESALSMLELFIGLQNDAKERSRAHCLELCMYRTHVCGLRSRSCNSGLALSHATHVQGVCWLQAVSLIDTREQAPG